LFAQAGSASFLDERYLLFVSHEVDVQQMLLAALGFVTRTMNLGCGGR